MKTVREAVLLAAGLGLRMRPATLDFPKPALPFLNRPIVHWILESLQAAGIQKVLVNLHHLPGLVRSAVESSGASLDAVFFQEPVILGTAGAFAQMAGHIQGEAFLVVNGDTLQEIDFDRLEGKLLSHDGALAALALRPARPGYTPVELSSKGMVTAFGRGGCMFTGAYAARRALLDRLPPRGPSELVKDLIGPLLPSGRVLGIVSDLPWEDLGDSAGFLSATMRALDEMGAGRRAPPAGSILETPRGIPLLRHETAHLEPGSVITAPAVLGEDCRVGAGARLGRVVLLPGAVLPPGEHLESAILSASGVLRVRS